MSVPSFPPPLQFSISAADAPRCECHSEPMLWHKNPRRKQQGTWVCRVRKRERDRAYLLTEKGRARKRRFRTQEFLTRLKELTKP